MIRTMTASCALAGILLLSGKPLRAEEPAIALPLAEWSEGQPTLEDFKGQPVALVFFTDSTA